MMLLEDGRTLWLPALAGAAWANEGSAAAT